MNSDLVLVLEAAAFAADKHRRQRRKDVDASPYINHPLALADILAREGGVDDAEVIAAALLHDTVEDTETTIGEIEARFGQRVAGIVAEVTDDKTLDPETRKRLQVTKASGKSLGAKLVKLADKTANLRDLSSAPPADWSDERKAKYFEWSGEVVKGLRGANPLLEAAFERRIPGEQPNRAANGLRPSIPAYTMPFSLAVVAGSPSGRSSRIYPSIRLSLGSRPEPICEPKIITKTVTKTYPW